MDAFEITPSQYKNQVGLIRKYSRKEILRFFLNHIPARIVNASYDSYSKFYEGQLRLGIPVSKKLIQSQHELQKRAASKLALTLYHIFFQITGQRIPRSTIKLVLIEEIDKKRLWLTENIILLTPEELKYLACKRFSISATHAAKIIEVANRRKILRESLKQDHIPAYFESDIEEFDHNGRGDYEIAYFRDFTNEGKSIGFQRIVSIEDVTSRDNQPSIILVPGFANNSNCFNLNNDYSIAKDMADEGFWVYLFDPRGMGVNRGKIDPYYTVDALIDHDLPTVTNLIYKRSKGKPVILTGHSMGGLVAESMVLNWSLRCKWDRIIHKHSVNKEYLNQILPSESDCRQSLRMIRGVISLGSPKYFEKMSHVIFPLLLWLNHFSRMLHIMMVPFREVIWLLNQLPMVRELSRLMINSNVGDLNFLVSPQNHLQDKDFPQLFINKSIESVPIGIGFQFIKAIYNGEGFKRMDYSRLNYTEYLSFMPEDIPVFHFWGTEDPISPINNISVSKYYPHKIKKIYHIKTPKDVKNIPLSSERSQLIDFVIEGANHLDLLYGKAASELIHPLLKRIIHKIWGDWSYGEHHNARLISRKS